MFGASVAGLTYSTPAEAVETTGQLKGTVVDKGGLPIPGVEVILRGPNLQGELKDKRSQGGFRIVAIPPGEYKVNFKKNGFQTTQAQGSGCGRKVLFLKHDAVFSTRTQEIVVVDTKPTVDVTNTVPAPRFQGNLRDIPNSGRSYQSATLLSQG